MQLADRRPNSSSGGNVQGWSLSEQIIKCPKAIRRCSPCRYGEWLVNFCRGNSCQTHLQHHLYLLTAGQHKTRSGWFCRGLPDAVASLQGVHGHLHPQAQQRLQGVCRPPWLSGAGQPCKLKFRRQLVQQPSWPSAALGSGKLEDFEACPSKGGPCAVTDTARQYFASSLTSHIARRWLSATPRTLQGSRRSSCSCWTPTARHWTQPCARRP